MTYINGIFLIIIFAFATFFYLKKGSNNNSSKNKLLKLLENVNSLETSNELEDELNHILIDSNLSIIILDSINSIKEKKYKSILIEKALTKKSDDILVYIKNTYQKSDMKTKYMYLEYLSIYGSSSAMEIFVEFLLRDYSNFEVLPIEKLLKYPRYSDVIFPRLMNLQLPETKRHQIYNLVNVYLKNKLLFSDKIDDIKEDVFAEYKNIAYDYERYNKKDMLYWRYESSNYIETRSKMLLLIELLGYIYDDEIIKELKRAVKFNDPLINAYSLISLVKLGESIDNYIITIETLCEYPQVRKYLYTELISLNLKMKFPYKFKEQKYLSQSEVFDQFISDGKIYAEPIKIKFYNEIEISDKYSLYVFICDVKYSKDDKINSILAYAGPYLKSELETSGHGLTFVRYEEFSQEDLNLEYVQNIVKARVNDWLLKI